LGILFYSLHRVALVTNFIVGVLFCRNYVSAHFSNFKVHSSYQCLWVDALMYASESGRQRPFNRGAGIAHPTGRLSETNGVPVRDYSLGGNTLGARARGPV
jgi:hypothetical protein